MWEALLVYGCWVFQGVAIFLAAYWAEPGRRRLTDEDDEWTVYLQ